METIVQVSAVEADAMHLSPKATNALRTLAVAAGSNPGTAIDEAFRRFEARKARLRREADAR